MKRTIKLICITFLIAFCAVAAQDNKEKSDFHSKLEKISGKVESIKIKTDKEEVEFTDKEAIKLFKLMKSSKLFHHSGNKLFLTSEDFDHKDAVINIFKGKGKHNFNWITSELDTSGSETKVEIKVDKNGDEISVTEKTTEDGKEKTKTYKGKEAEEFLKKHNKHKKMSFYIVDDENHKSFSDEDINIFITKELDSDEFLIDSLKEKIEIKIDGDEVIIKEYKDKNGETVEKIYKGKEAEEFLKKHGHTDSDIFILNRDDKCCSNEDIMLEIKIDDDGEKILEIKTIKDGKESIEIFKGEAADKYLEENHKGNKKFIKINLQDKGKHKRVIKTRIKK